MKLQPLISLDKFADVNHGVFSTEVPLIVTNGMGTEIRAYIMQSLIHEQQSNRIQIMSIYLNLTFHSNLWSSILWSWKVTFVSSKPNLCNALLPGSSVSFTSGVSPRIWPHPRCLDPLRSGRTIPSYVSENHPCCRTEIVAADEILATKEVAERGAPSEEMNKKERCAYWGERLWEFVDAGWMDLFFNVSVLFCECLLQGISSSLSIHE